MSRPARIAPLAFLAILGACAAFSPPKDISGLSKTEQETFWRCQEEVLAHDCSGFMGDKTAEALCEREIIDQYASARDKRRWLLQHGCLPETVDNRPR